MQLWSAVAISLFVAICAYVGWRTDRSVHERCNRNPNSVDSDTSFGS